MPEPIIQYGKNLVNKLTILKFERHVLNAEMF